MYLGEIPVDGVLASIRTRRQTDVSLEVLRQVALMRESGHRRHLSQGQVS
jgi:hypothetical protein